MSEINWTYFQGEWYSRDCDETIDCENGKYRVWLGGRIKSRHDSLEDAKGAVSLEYCHYWLSKADY